VRAFFFESVDDACNAVLDKFHVKVDEQAKSLIGKPQVGQELLFVDGVSSSTDFISMMTLSLDYQVSSESGFDADDFIDHRDRLLAGPCGDLCGRVHTPRWCDRPIPASLHKELYGCDRLRRRSLRKWRFLRRKEIVPFF
jgi:hypothetical protein